MSMRSALRHALRDMYEQSWRLVLLNSALSAVVLAVVVVVSYVPAALVLAVGVGPFAAALMHCAVRLVREQELTLSCALEGFRLLWLRGLQLAALVGVVVFAGVVAVRAYGSAGALTWPLAFVVAYLLAFFVVFQLVLWPLAVAERERPLRRVLADAAVALVRRPRSSVALALALLLINALGAVAAVLPLLTMTVAYSFVAAARFALPPNPLAEAQP
ncbi:MAG: hypothetical protein H0W14_03800 [Actinobacteria bacterium]|nr:hypothetical protein [Actinomycetota bacterium]